MPDQRLFFVGGLDFVVRRGAFDVEHGVVTLPQFRHCGRIHAGRCVCVCVCMLAQSVVLIAGVVTPDGEGNDLCATYGENEIPCREGGPRE